MIHVDIEKLLEDAVESKVDEKLETFLNELSNRWVYFYFLQPNGIDTKPGNGNIEVILATSKDNPINIPSIKNKEGNNGVLYTNLEIAKESTEFNCKIGKMKGTKAFEMFYGINHLDSIYIQGNFGYILLNKTILARLASNA